MYNTSNSILFMTSARQAIKYLVGVSESADPYYIKEMQDFIMNEATDYQVMSLLVTGELPDERFNIEEEVDLFDTFRDYVLENFSSFQNSYGFDIANELVNEVGPLSPYGIDTASSVLTHLYESGAINVLIEKKKGYQGAGMTKGKQANMAFQKAKLKGKAKVSSAKDAIKGGVSSVKQKAGDAAFDARVKARAAKKRVPHKIKGAVKTGGEKMKAAPGKAKDLAKTGYGKGKNLAKAGTTDAYAQMKGGAQKYKKYAGKKGAVGKAMKADARSSMLKGGGKMLATAAVITAAIYAGTKLYKNYMSKAARTCAGNPNKGECMANYKKQAIRAQISAVQSGASKCATTKNPEKCKAGVAAKVQSLNAKLAKA